MASASCLTRRGGVLSWHHPISDLVVPILLPMADHSHFHDRNSDFDHFRFDPFLSQLLLLDGWLGLQGWQCLFILEALPPVILGVVVMVYLTGTPAQAKWLLPDQQQWLIKRLAAERTQRESTVTIDWARHSEPPRLAAHGGLFWPERVGIRVRAVPVADCQQVWRLNQPGRPDKCDPLRIRGYRYGSVGMAFRPDGRAKQARSRACLLAFAGLAICVFIDDPVIMMVALVLAQMGQSAIAPTFWPLPTAMLSGTAAAGGIAMINAVGNLGGFLGPSLVGLIKDATGSFSLGRLAS